MLYYIYIQVLFQKGKEVNQKYLIQVTSFYFLICQTLPSVPELGTHPTTLTHENTPIIRVTQLISEDSWSGHETDMKLIPSLSSMALLFFNPFHIPWTSLLATAGTKSSVCQHKCIEAGRHSYRHSAFTFTLTGTHTCAHTHTHSVSL